MRKLMLLMALGAFLSASSASACDGDKACATKVKGKKAHATKTASACMKNGKCDMKAMKAGADCDMKAMKAGSKCDMKAMKSGKTDCCKSKAEAAKS